MNEPELNECTRGFLRQMFINYRIGLKRAEFDLVIRPLFWPSLVQKSIPIKLGSSLTSRTFSKGGISLSRNDSSDLRFLVCFKVSDNGSYPWIGEKNPKRGTITERVLLIKSGAQHWIDLYMFLCFGFFSWKTRSVTVPMAYTRGSKE